MTVYFIQGEITKRIKIGVTTNVEKRFQSIKHGTSERVKLIATMDGDTFTEGSLHRKYFRARRYGEWFEPTQEIKSMIRHLPTFCGFIDQEYSRPKIETQAVKRTLVEQPAQKQTYVESIGLPQDWKVARAAPGINRKANYQEEHE